MKWKQDTAYKKELGLKMIENVHLVLNGKVLTDKKMILKYPVLFIADSFLFFEIAWKSDTA